MKRIRIFGGRVAIVLAIVAQALMDAGCTVMRPMDEGSWRFLMGRSYSSTEYQTTFITKKGERIVAAPLCARVYDVANEKSLRLTLDNSFAIPFSELRAFTFNTAMRITTMMGQTFDVEEGEWWFLVNKGRADAWMKGPAPVAGIDSSASVIISSKRIRSIDVAAQSPLVIGLVYGICAGSAAAIILLAIPK